MVGKLHPVYYCNRKSFKNEEKLRSCEMEILAVVRSLEKFKMNLLGLSFKKVTNCQVIKHAIGFEYRLEHRVATKMRHVDALSRYSLYKCCENSLVRQVEEIQKTGVATNIS